MAAFWRSLPLFARSGFSMTAHRPAKTQADREIEALAELDSRNPICDGAAVLLYEGQPKAI